MTKFDVTDQPIMVRNQPGNYLTFNDAVQALEDSLHRTATHALSDANYTMTAAQAATGFMEFTGSLTADRNIDWPQTGNPAANQPRRQVIKNSTGHDLLVGYSTGSRATVGQGESVLVRGDGTDVVLTVDLPASGLTGGTPDSLNDFLIYWDTSAGQWKSVTPDGLGAGGGGGSSGGGGGGGLVGAALVKLDSNQTINTSESALAWDSQAGGGVNFNGHKFWLGANITFTADNTNEEITATAHGMISEDGLFQFSNSGGALPAGFSVSTDYWAIRVDDNTFQVASSLDNAKNRVAINITDNGTGTHTIEREERIVIPWEITKVQLVGNVISTSGVDTRMSLFKNGAIANPGFRQGEHVNGTGRFQSGLTGIIEVNDGVDNDYFELMVVTDTSGRRYI